MVVIVFMLSTVSLTWETLLQSPAFLLRRASRYLVAALDGPHVVLSTSVRNGGQQEGLRYLVNHQSCEATSHLERHDIIAKLGQEAYHDLVCTEMGLAPSEVAMM